MPATPELLSRCQIAGVAGIYSVRVRTRKLRTLERPLLRGSTRQPLFRVLTWTEYSRGTPPETAASDPARDVAAGLIPPETAVAGAGPGAVCSPPWRSRPGAPLIGRRCLGPGRTRRSSCRTVCQQLVAGSLNNGTKSIRKRPISPHAPSRLPARAPAQPPARLVYCR
jgi:hypothetical protein